jgi:hypothetical protein
VERFLKVLELGMMNTTMGNMKGERTSLLRKITNSTSLTSTFHKTLSLIVDISQQHFCSKCNKKIDQQHVWNNLQEVWKWNGWQLNMISPNSWATMDLSLSSMNLTHLQKTNCQNHWSFTFKQTPKEIFVHLHTLLVIPKPHIMVGWHVKCVQNTTHHPCCNL